MILWTLIGFIIGLVTWPVSSWLSNRNLEDDYCDVCVQCSGDVHAGGEYR